MAKKKLQTGTSRGQRIAIWAIMVLTIGSTIALYVGSILSNKNQNEENKRKMDQLTAYRAAVQEYQNKVDAQAKKLSAKYYSNFVQYKNSASAFNAANAEALKEVEKKDLVVGEGEEITSETNKFTAYYIGWKPDGTVFDGSFNDDSLKAPFVAKKTANQWNVITGWADGVQGMKAGGVRELTIPSNLAYGAQGSKNQQDSSKSIDANMPIKFVLIVIPSDEVEEFAMPNYADYIKE
ncbi:MAG: FKBP-type peptidyl-prolyl cis-trans isomerase [bacterium]|nr:FKBP-type peptidyl-prolyl cis-trans isomerase [bacterium]